MRKVLCVLVMCSLLGCGVNEKKSDLDVIPESLLNNIKQTLPDSVYDELSKNGRCKTIDNTLRLVSGKNLDEDPALCLDFTYKDNTLIEYVYKPYSDGSFVNATLSKDKVSEEEAINVAQQFARVFFKEERKISKTDDLSGYDTGDYITLTDEYDNIYLIQLNGGLIFKYVGH